MYKNKKKLNDYLYEFEKDFIHNNIEDKINIEQNIDEELLSYNDLRLENEQLKSEIKRLKFELLNKRINI